jgi:nucleoside-diphosphate-sugar epimerase
VAEVVQTVLDLLGIQREVTFENRPISSDDNSILVGSAERLTSATGWQPRVDLKESLQSMLRVRE